MKIGDFVKADEQIGIIVSKYNAHGNFDWEVVALKGRFGSGCKQDCYKECDLEIYDWRNYPKTFIEKLKLLFGIRL